MEIRMIIICRLCALMRYNIALRWQIFRCSNGFFLCCDEVVALFAFGWNIFYIFLCVDLIFLKKMI